MEIGSDAYMEAMGARLLSKEEAKKYDRFFPPPLTFWQKVTILIGDFCGGNRRR